MKVASQNASDWYEATSLCSAQPSPLSGFDMFNYMALIVCMRGKPECGMTFRKLKEELLGKIERGECGLKGATASCGMASRAGHTYRIPIKH